MMDDDVAYMTQTARHPTILDDLVKATRYKKDWRFTLEDVDRGQGSVGLTLCIRIVTPDSYHPEQTRAVMHYFPVPPAAYDVRSWRRWLFDQILLVEQHEACEFFQLVIPLDGSYTKERTERPYAPSHGPGNSPYLIREVGTVKDVRTQYTGEVKS